MPLYTLLLALGSPTVHWLSLDIEGAELAVLRTLPWHLVDIEMLSVETHLAGWALPGSQAEIFSLLEAAGYSRTPHPASWDPARHSYKDWLFVRRDVVARLCGTAGEAEWRGIKQTVCSQQTQNTTK